MRREREKNAGQYWRKNETWEQRPKDCGRDEVSKKDDKLEESSQTQSALWSRSKPCVSGDMFDYTKLCDESMKEEGTSQKGMREIWPAQRMGMKGTHTGVVKAWTENESTETKRETCKEMNKENIKHFSFVFFQEENKRFVYVCFYYCLATQLCCSALRSAASFMFYDLLYTDFLRCLEVVAPSHLTKPFSSCCLDFLHSFLGIKFVCPNLKISPHAKNVLYISLFPNLQIHMETN